MGRDRGAKGKKSAAQLEKEQEEREKQMVKNNNQMGDTYQKEWLKIEDCDDKSNHAISDGNSGGGSDNEVGVS